MDNISHSMVGLYLGEVIHQALPADPDVERQKSRRRLLLTSGLVASNLPDLDLVFSNLLPAPLGYLLHHRGHTHTFLFLIPQAILFFALLMLFPGVRKSLRDPVVKRGLGLAIGLGLVFHICCDFLNSYGVHPFYPLNSDWYYGDAVFIVEPMFWVTLGVAFCMSLQARWRKVSFLSLLFALIIYCTMKKLISPATGMSLLVVAGMVIVAAQYKLARGFQTALALFLAYVGLQFVMSSLAGRQIVQALKTQDPEAIVRDIALTAMPTNFACWTFVSVHEDKTPDYKVSKGQLSIFPELVPTKDCHWLYKFPVESRTGNIEWLEKASGPTEKLRQLVRENCRFENWMRFARVPWVADGRATDLRYSSLQDLNFSTMLLSEFDGSECSGYIPPWGHPRADLLEGSTLER